MKRFWELLVDRIVSFATDLKLANCTSRQLFYSNVSLAVAKSPIFVLTRRRLSLSSWSALVRCHRPVSRLLRVSCPHVSFCKSAPIEHNDTLVDRTSTMNAPTHAIKPVADCLLARLCDCCQLVGWCVHPGDCFTSRLIASTITHHPPSLSRCLLFGEFTRSWLSWKRRWRHEAFRQTLCLRAAQKRLSSAPCKQICIRASTSSSLRL